MSADPSGPAHYEWPFLATLNDKLRPLRDAIEIQDVAARLLGEYLAVNRVSYAAIEGNEFVVGRSYVRGVAPFTGRGPVSMFGQALIDRYRRGDTVAVNDVGTDARFTEAERAGLLAHDIAAFVGVMVHKDGRWVAAFGVHNATPRAWTREDIELIEVVSERSWAAAERASAEVALREREQRLRLALEASGGGCWTWDAAGNQIHWDDGFRARYGISADEPATFDAWLARVHEEDRAQVLGLLDEIQRSTMKDAWDNTFRIVRDNGTIAWIQSRGRAERDGAGRVTRLTGLDLDITQRRLAEETLQARREEERDRALQALLQTSTQGIVSVDTQGRIVTANPALEMMFGWAPGELIGQSIERLLPASFRELHAAHRTRYFASPVPRLMGGGLHLVGERKDGSTFPIEVGLNHVTTPSGERAFAFVTDITERQRAASALHDRTVELERRTAQLSQMASDLTLAEQHAREQIARTLHDGLQQMLVVAALNLDHHLKRDADSGIPPSEPLVQAKTTLDEAIDAARSLSFELFPPVLQHAELPAALTWLANWTRDKYGLEVHVTADRLATSARKDVRTLLFESVRELLFNAVKHARVDRVDLDLGIFRDDQICITVTDQGIGFDPAALVDRLKAGQVGWGLFSIRERLTQLGGRFDVDSAPGKGTRFRLLAPRSIAPDPAAAHAPIRQAAGGPAIPMSDAHAPPRALRILIVDDHAAVREVFRNLLHQRSVLRVVGEAADGLEAIEQAHALRPDAVLMDISMPRMNGVEATRRIRAELPSIRILGLSMQPRTEDLHAIEEAGAAGFFIKGIDTQRLIDYLVTLHAGVSAAPSLDR